jgi:predicted nucleic acid-binding protein
MKGIPKIKENLMRRYHCPMKISAVTFMELYYGAYKSQKIEDNLEKIKILEQSFAILPLTMKSVELFGMLKAELELKGTRIDDFDLMIGACALTHNLILVTNNEKHFQRIKGIKLENWTK